MSGDYVSVEPKVFVVCVLVASVPLMADSFNCEKGAVDLVYKVKNAQGGKSDENEDDCREDGSDNFNFLGV